MDANHLKLSKYPQDGHRLLTDEFDIEDIIHVYHTDR